MKWIFTTDPDGIRKITPEGKNKDRDAIMCNTDYYPWCPDSEDDWKLIGAAPELAEVVKSFIAETVDYMTINNLGDPEKQHNVKWGRTILAKAGL